MPRKLRPAKVANRTDRLKLPQRRAPHGLTNIAPGIRLGYRRTKSAGTWVLECTNGMSGEWQKRVGVADDYEEANGEDVLTFWQAADKARTMARGTATSRPVTWRDALADYEGTVIVVSHDRYFLNRAVDQLVVFETPGRTVLIHGNYDTYERMAALQTPVLPVQTARPVRPVLTKAAGARPKRRFPYRKVEDLEREIAECESRLRELEQLMANPDLYRDGERVKSVTKDFETDKAELAQLYEHWEEAVELN